MGTVIGAALAVLAGLAVATTTVVGVVQTQKDEPSTSGNQPPVVQYGQR